MTACAGTCEWWTSKAKQSSNFLTPIYLSPDENKRWRGVDTRWLGRRCRRRASRARRCCKAPRNRRLAPGPSSREIRSPPPSQAWIEPHREAERKRVGSWVVSWFCLFLNINCVLASPSEHLYARLSVSNVKKKKFLIGLDNIQMVWKSTTGRTKCHVWEAQTLFADRHCPY